MDVMFYEAFEEEEAALKKFLPEDISAEFTWKTIQEEGHKDSPAKIVSVRTQSRIPLEWAGTIKGILTRSQGFDHLLAYRHQTEMDIPCGYLENYCARAVAEQAVLTMMMLLRKLKAQMRHFDTFDRNHLTGKECQGRKALVMGVGHIGTQIVDIVKGLRMEVKGVDIAPKLKDLEYVLLDEGVSWADVIFCAAPLTEETKAMLSYTVLKKVRPGAIFINISRGEISPIQDLKQLLEDDILGGLGLDVYPEESRLANYLRGHLKELDETIQTILELQNKDNVIFTPHNAFNTQEAVDQKARLSVEAVKTFMEKGFFPYQIL